MSAILGLGFLVLAGGSIAAALGAPTWVMATTVIFVLVTPPLYVIIGIVHRALSAPPGGRS